MTQLALNFDRPVWRMTLAEFRDLMLSKPVLDQAWYGPFEYEESYELRDRQRDAYIRVAYKRAVIQARNAGEPVPHYAYASHPILAAIYAGVTP